MSIHLDACATKDAKATPPPSTQSSDRSVGPSTLFTGRASCDSAAMTQSSLLPSITAVPNQYTSLSQDSDGSTDDVMSDSSSFGANTASTDDDGSFQTVLSYLQKNDEWMRHMDTVDQLENITFLRVMYLGVSTADERRLVLKKLSDGLSRPLRSQPTNSMDATHTDTSSSSSMIKTHDQLNTPLAFGFRERKHHLLPLHFFSTDLLDNDDDRTALFEDNGVYIVEADFTTDGQHLQDPNIVLSYIYHHCQKRQQVSSSALQLILNPPSPVERLRRPIYDDDSSSSSGIDLCIYFYHDAQTRISTNKELDLLWKIHALQIPILPVLSMSNPLLRSGYNSNLRQRPTETRRSELANLFSLWRIKTMDLSNLDMLGQPSFQRKDRSPHDFTLEDKQIEKRLGPLWANSSIVAPTPYHILTLFQFLAIDRWAISKLISTIKSQKRWNTNSTKDHTEASYSSTSTATNASSSAMTDDSMMIKLDKAYSTLYNGTTIKQGTGLLSGFHLLCALPIIVLLGYGLLIALTRHSSSLHASLALVSYQPGQSMDIMLSIYDNHNQPRWAPEPPLIETNIPSSGQLIVAPLPNKTRSFDGQYFYSVGIPPCITLKDTVRVRIKPSVKHRIHANPLHLSLDLLCNPSMNSPMIAWRHFRQYYRFYLTHSLKILRMVFTEGDN